MDGFKEFVVAIDPKDIMAKNRIEAIIEHFCDNRPIFDNVIAIYMECGVEFDQVKDQVRAIVTPCDYVIFETLNRVGEGDF